MNRWGGCLCDSEADWRISRKTITLDGKVYCKQPDEPTIDLDGICTTSAKASWFSPVPGDVGVPGGDLRVLRDARHQDNATIVTHAFMSCCCSFQHRCIMRRANGTGTDFATMLPLWHYRESAAYCWPVHIAEVPKYPAAKYLVFDHNIRDLCSVSISQWDDIVVQPIRFRGLSYQARAFRDARNDWAPEIRAFIDGPEMPLTQFAAQSGWWDFDLTLLRKVAQVLGHDISSSTTLMQALFQLTQEVTKLPDSDVMSYLAHRLVAKPNLDAAATEILLNIDEAASCLEAEEEKKLRSEQQHEHEVFANLIDLHDEYRAMRREQKQSKKKSGPNKKTKIETRQLPASLEMLPQPQLKKYFPPQCSLWKSRTANSWNIRVKNWPEQKSRSCRNRTETEALRLLVTEAWWQYCVLEGEDFEDCPVTGLLSVEALWGE